MGAEVNAAAVRRFRCFEGLSEAEAEAVARTVEPVQLADGEALFRQGDPGTAVYLLVSGRAAVQIASDGGERELASLEEGAILGEMGLVLNEPRAASVVARGSAELWKISSEAFQSALDRQEPWATKFLLATSQVLAHRLGTVNEQLGKLIGEMKTAEAPQATRVAELEKLRSRLFTEWSF